MRRHRAVLQTFRHMDPAEAVLVQDKWRIARNCIESLCVSGRARKSGGLPGTNPATSMPVHFVRRVPPDQFFAFAPRLAGRSRARAIINDAAIARPGEAPAMAEIIFGISREFALFTLSRTKHTGVNPAPHAVDPSAFNSAKPLICGP